MSEGLQKKNKKRIREDGVPTLGELSAEMRAFEQLLLQNWLEACADKETLLTTYERFNSIGSLYKTHVVDPSEDSRLTEDKRVEMSRAISTLLESLPGKHHHKERNEGPPIEVVISTSYGGFGLSPAGIQRYATLKNLQLRQEGEVFYKEEDGSMFWPDKDIRRDDPDLVETVYMLEQEANGQNAFLKVVELPPGTKWEIHQLDGSEWISEKGKVWR